MKEKNIHQLYTEKNYKKYTYHNTYSIFRNGNYFENIFRLKIKELLKRIPLDKLNNIKYILDIGGGEGDKTIFFINDIFKNFKKAYILDYSDARIKKGNIILIL